MGCVCVCVWFDPVSKRCHSALVSSSSSSNLYLLYVNVGDKITSL